MLTIMARLSDRSRQAYHDLSDRLKAGPTSAACIFVSGRHRPEEGHTVTDRPDPAMEERIAWRRSAFWRSIGLGTGCGAALGALLGLLLMSPIGSALIVPLTVLAGAIAGALVGLTGGLALLACRPAVRRSRVIASLVAGAGAAVVPLAVMLWVLIRHWPGDSGDVSIAASLIALASGAGLGPLAVAGKTGWSRHRNDTPAASATDPGGAA
jgi:hypothetical protein